MHHRRAEGDGDYLLFKNKDFGRTHFDDRLVTEPAVFGVRGVSTWAGTDPDLDEFSGFSIGANQHGLLCCDSNVRTLQGHANYDELTEIALREGRDVGSAVAAVGRAVESRPYLWANLIMIDASGAAAVEVRGDRIEATELTAPTARSNHHVVLEPHPDDDDTVTTAKRLAAAQRRLDGGRGIDDVFESAALPRRRRHRHLQPPGLPDRLLLRATAQRRRHRPARGPGTALHRPRARRADRAPRRAVVRRRSPRFPGLVPVGSSVRRRLKHQQSPQRPRLAAGRLFGIQSPRRPPPPS